jgi:LPPG:FO 2-phospho-L-lactate transferase
MLVVFTGGTGGAKLIQGLAQEIDPSQLTIICNTADDVVLHGLNVCPDLDTIMYTLAGMNDAAKGWGIEGDSFTVLAQLKKFGAEAWFSLGDKDLATHIIRTGLLREGRVLSEVTKRITKRLGIKAAILPMTDDAVETRVVTAEGEMSFQEYFVKHRWQPVVKKVFYAGIEESRPAAGVIKAIRDAQQIIICPSNPITSIGPILAVPGIRDAIKKASVPVIGVSPLIGGSAISGPADRLMRAQGWEPSATGVANAYRDFLHTLLIDTADEKLRDKIRELGIRAVATSIRMDSHSDRARLAREILALVEK